MAQYCSHLRLFRIMTLDLKWFTLDSFYLIKQHVIQELLPLIDLNLGWWLELTKCGLRKFFCTYPFQKIAACLHVQCPIFEVMENAARSFVLFAILITGVWILPGPLTFHSDDVKYLVASFIILNEAFLPSLLSHKTTVPTNYDTFLNNQHSSYKQVARPVSKRQSTIIFSVCRKKIPVATPTSTVLIWGNVKWETVKWYDLSSQTKSKHHEPPHLFSVILFESRVKTHEQVRQQSQLKIVCAYDSLPTSQNM